MYRAFASMTAARMTALALAAALLAPGCGGSRRLETRALDDGTTIHTLRDVEVKVEGATKHYGFEEGTSSVEKRCVLDVRAREEAGRETDFELLVTYEGTNALNIEPGRSLEIVADWNSYVLSASGGVERARDPSGRGYTESLAYAVSADVLVAMAEAETLRLILKGRDGDARGTFEEKSLAEFRMFVDSHARPR